jgi:hypothetical protein
MRTAWSCAILGTFAAFWIGRFRFELGLGEILLCLVAANIAGLCALLVTLKGERTPWIRRHVFTRQAKTWLFFLTVFFGVLLGVAYPMRRDLTTFAWMVGPAIFSTGFCVAAFGPIQDGIVARIQRRSRAP